MKNTHCKKKSTGTFKALATKKRGVIVNRPSTPKERLEDNVSAFVSGFYSRHRKVMTKLAYE